MSALIGHPANQARLRQVPGKYGIDAAFTPEVEERVARSLRGKR